MEKSLTKLSTNSEARKLVAKIFAGDVEWEKLNEILQLAALGVAKRILYSIEIGLHPENIVALHSGLTQEMFDFIAQSLAESGLVETVGTTSNPFNQIIQGLHADETNVEFE